MNGQAQSLLDAVRSPIHYAGPPNGCMPPPRARRTWVVKSEARAPAASRCSAAFCGRPDSCSLDAAALRGGAVM
jgi:hypothetical protein